MIRVRVRHHHDVDVLGPQADGQRHTSATMRAFLEYMRNGMVSFERDLPEVIQKLRFISRGEIG
jgi:hypothetical protein